jgi:hypothetical protein
VTAVNPQFEGPALDPAFDPTVAPEPAMGLPAPLPNPADVAPALADQPFAQTTAMPPPPVPGGQLTPDQLASAATGLPPSPPPVPVVPPPTTPVEGAKQNAEKTAALGAEQVANAEEGAGLNTERAQLAETFKGEYAKALQDVLDRQAIHRQAAETAVTDARIKAESQPYHTYFESRTIGQNVATAIGLILGGISWNAGHVNRGVQLLETNMAQDLEKQKAQHADLWKAVEAAERGEKDLDVKQLRDLSAFNASQGAKWDAVSGRLNAMIAANKGKGDVSTAKKTALEASEKANAFWANATAGAATAQHLTNEEQIQRDRIAEQERVAALRKKKAGGGGGGGSGAGASAKIQLEDELDAAKKAGTPIDQRFVDKLAVKYKIPLVGKPTTVNARTIFQDWQTASGKAAGQEGKEHVLTEKDEKEVVRNEKGMAIGRVTSGKGGAQGFTTRDVQFGDAARRVKDLADDIRENGATINPLDNAAIIRRATKYANAIIALGVVSPLGKTNESLKLEAESLGFSSGAISPDHLIDSLKKAILYGANLDAVESKFKDINGVRNQYRTQTLIPLSAEEKSKFNKNVAVASSHPDLTLKDGRKAKWNDARGGYEAQ